MSWERIDDYAVPTATQLKDQQMQWIRENNFTTYTSSEGLDVDYALHKGRIRYADIDPLPYQMNDHGRIYKDPQSGEVVALIQPYSSEEGEADLYAWAIRHGITVERLPVSWYYPERTTAFILRRAEE